jgi:hypothetical protein
VLKGLDTKLSISRVMWDLVELYLVGDLVVEMLDGGEKVMRDSRI